MKRNDLVAHDMANYLKERGAEIIPPTNPYEVLRFRACGEIQVIYRDKNGAVTVPDAALKYVTWFERGEKLDLSNPKTPERPLVMPITANTNLRDHFAGQALMGILMFLGTSLDDDELAQRAYAKADAMLRAREAK